MAAAGAAAAAIANAVKASGTIVKVKPEEFARILARQPGLLVGLNLAKAEILAKPRRDLPLIERAAAVLPCLG